LILSLYKPSYTVTIFNAATVPSDNLFNFVPLTEFTKTQDGSFNFNSSVEVILYNAWSVLYSLFYLYGLLWIREKGSKIIGDLFDV